ncbi:hypothetical protein TSUD_211500 [Trifolium subterraneum]|uniref:J domain-containing protein n=1 Tax=Trifolium subterraneum TaxID=3900 RepID=A0A2Z6NHD9_TRISU|nr:hypothetical protein TSUD_211500 [Trifolium subterraneum]
MDSQFHNFSSGTGSRYPYSVIGASSFSERSEEGESAQRCRARMERCRRTADRAAKALEEKNMRDLILGPDSGWQPIPLTDVITSAAAKKAYRKATLCVHPDKLQQRGASIQHKYICEKVFDLLKICISFAAAKQTMVLLQNMKSIRFTCTLSRTCISI